MSYDSTSRGRISPTSIASYVGPYITSRSLKVSNQYYVSILCSTTGCAPSVAGLSESVKRVRGQPSRQAPTSLFRACLLHHDPCMPTNSSCVIASSQARPHPMLHDGRRIPNKHGPTQLRGRPFSSVWSPLHQLLASLHRYLRNHRPFRPSEIYSSVFLREQPYRSSSCRRSFQDRSYLAKLSWLRSRLAFRLAGHQIELIEQYRQLC